MTTDTGSETRVLAATGVCGSGFREASLEEAMRRQPHFIGCDCGSTDPGLYALRQRPGLQASIPRPVFQGDLLDSDNHGGQQYAPLMGIEIPEVPP